MVQQEKMYRQKGYHANVIVRERRKLYRELNPERSLFDGAKCRARKKNQDFTITINDITIPDVCPIFRTSFVKYDRKLTASLDRIDNSKGYIKGNVRVISNRANIMKGDMSIEDIERLLAYAKGEL